MALKPNPRAHLLLEAEDLLQIEQALQNQASTIIQNDKLSGISFRDTVHSETYKANRHLWMRVWDALYS